MFALTSIWEMGPRWVSFRFPGGSGSDYRFQPDGILMKGVRYTLNQWYTLVRFLDDGRIREASNNGCERALRAPVIGRKNWGFFGSEEGNKAGLMGD